MRFPVKIFFAEDYRHEITVYPEYTYNNNHTIALLISKLVITLQKSFEF